MRTIKFKIIKNNITAIAKKNNEEIIFGSNDGKIFLFKKNQKITQIDKVDAEIFSILLNSKDEYIVFSNKSIYFNKNNYIPKKETNFYGKVRAKYSGTKLIQPDFIYLDKLNFLWFAFDEDEWGGNVCFFDLNKKEFIYEHWLIMNDGIKYEDRNEYFKKLKETYSDKIKITEKDTIYQYPFQMNISSLIKGVAYDKQNNLFISSSGGGFNSIFATEKDFNYFVDGMLVKISKKENSFYKSCFDENVLENEKYKYAFESDFLGFKNKDRELREKILTENEINVLGSISYNTYDDNLYMYCSKGFQIIKNLNCNFSEELVFKPNLTCKYDNTRKYCLHLNVIKFEFISEKEILFLTRYDGIGYYNGKNVKYFK